MDALSQARKRLSSRICDPKLMLVPGLAADLRAIAAAFDELDRRTDVLAAALLRMLIDTKLHLHPAQLQRLSSMGEESAALVRVIEAERK